MSEIREWFGPQQARRPMKQEKRGVDLKQQPSNQSALKSVGRFIMKHAGWIFAGAFVIALSITVLISYNIVVKTKISMDEFEIKHQRLEEIYVNLSRVISDYSNEERTRIQFISATGPKIIEDAYLERRVKERDRLTPSQLTEFLVEIADNVDSGVFPVKDYYLPLAFAYVETQFIPGAVGRDGERSMFQFMEYTARSEYLRMAIPYSHNWWFSVDESTTLWFNHYRYLYGIFADRAEPIPWIAMAYNGGMYRNGLLYAARNNYTIDKYVQEFRPGNPNYYKEIVSKYEEYLALASEYMD